MDKRVPIQVFSETGILRGVITHRPGLEVENMTPGNAEKALYSDILNLKVANKEYADFHKALSMHAQTYEVQDLFSDILEEESTKESLVRQICKLESKESLIDYLLELPANELARQLFEGVVIKRDSLTNFLEQDRYALSPLPNFYFMRDASMSVWNEVLIGKMANQVRDRESLIMKSIFDHHKVLKNGVINPLDAKHQDPLKMTVEGGDVQIANENTLCIGMGSRTTSQSIDYLIEHFKQSREDFNIIVQELPHKPESFIHLDMVFTFLNSNEVMAYEPIMLRPNSHHTILIQIRSGKATFTYKSTILEALKECGMDMQPLLCGGKDEWSQEREQWHSGCNFFSVAPGKIFGYGRNVHTMEELSAHGYAILPAADVAQGKINIADYKKYCVAIEGSELARGGGGCRCMTMPIYRD